MELTPIVYYNELWDINFSLFLIFVEKLDTRLRLTPFVEW